MYKVLCFGTHIKLKFPDPRCLNLAGAGMCIYMRHCRISGYTMMGSWVPSNSK